MSKKFTELNAGTIGAGSIFAQAQEPALSGDPFISTKVSATQIANYVAKGQAFTELNNHTLIEAITGGSGAGTVILTMAQYLALTPAQQTDGHIYVISDFACLFCYGRQYRAMQKLTQAQYNQLSSAEQNDGTLYIITDAATSIGDVDDVDLTGLAAGNILRAVSDGQGGIIFKPFVFNVTTSDNNKLLGVSVSGSDISVEAVSTNCDVSKIKFIHFENVVVSSSLNPAGVIKSSAIDSNILATTFQFLQIMNSSSGIVYGAYVRKDNGNICAGEVIPASNAYQISGFIYLA
ncbi:hypothetical protein [Ruminococcus sp.]|uniref:hypothetical protein n=1 Tax=Ruminococcus sp. TaxID=41978 RepID=UPI00386DE2E4